MSLLTSSFSKAGRRIVLQFMLVASVPLLALGWLAHEALTAQARVHNQRQLDQEVGNDAMRVFDRLLAARVALELQARAAAAGAGTPQTPSGVFRTVVVVEPGSPSPLVHWWLSQPMPGAQRLHWTPAGADQAARFVLSAIEPGNERTWLGEIDPDWLWFDTFGASDSHRGWVVDAAGRLLHTSGHAAHDDTPAQAADGPAMRGTEKPLFLGHEFGTTDWVFHERRPDVDASVQGVALGGLALKVVAAALLLVATLSLVQIRRTMDPLQRLVAVTRRLAQHDYGARVALTGDDEFRELGESFNDMAQRMGAQAEALTHQASHDSLTGLRNRAGLHRALDDALAAGRPFALVFVDLDRFKGVNDSLGHHAGDVILRQAATRLQATLPAGAIVARPGGDEFVVLLEGNQVAADAAARGVCGPLAEVFEIEGREIVLGASVGWARFPDDGRSAVELMRHADMAMYSAKAHGRGQARRYTPALDAEAAQHAWVINDLRLALERGQFLLHYQPRVDAKLGIAHGAEALVRWQHPQRGLVSPALFIEIAEETGMIRELGRWVLREACRQLAQWRREGVAIEHVSVNLSALQLASDAVVDEVLAAIADHGLQPSNLELEVTESLFIGDASAAAARLARLRERGIAIALDDFGTGYSSMAYLSRMPVDVMKIDRAFVKQLGEDRAADTVTRAIVTLAHSLDLRLVAEGVETAAQADALKAMGCHQLQGYFYAKPVAAADYPRLACVAAETTVAEV